MGKKLLTSLCIVGFSTILQAQTKIEGRIMNKAKMPVANINIAVFGKQTKTDDQGVFFLQVDRKGDFTVHLSGVGFQSQVVQVNPQSGNTVLGTLLMQESDHQLAEVEIMGYNSLNNKTIHVGKGGIVDKDLPQAVQIINTKVIQDQQINRLSDALKNANGVAMGSNRGGTSENFFARGYSLGSNNIFMNGARTNNGGSLEASTLESVEILKGSAALLYGGVTGGAVVNMVTKQPKFEYGAEASIRVGSYDFYKPTVDVYGPISNKLAFRVIATAESAKSYRDYVASKRVYVNPSVLYKIADKTSLNFTFDHLKSDNTPDFGIGTVDGKIKESVGRNTFLNVPWAYNNTNSSNGQINLNHVFSENWKLNAIGSFQDYNRDYFGSERINPKANGLATLTLNKIKTHELTFNQQVNVSGKFKTARIKHQVLLGADADQSKTDANAYNIFANKNKPTEITTAYGSIDVFHPVVDTLTYIPTTTDKTRTGTNIYRYGFFVQDLIELTPQFKVLAGIRYTYQKTKQSEVYDYASNTTEIKKNLGKDDAVLGDKIDQAWSPKFGLIYQPFKTTSFYVSYANNFTSNSGYDIDLKPMGPSIIDQFEAGVKNDFFQGKLSTNLTWYRINNNRFAQALVAADGTIKDPNMKEFTGKTASDGLEVDIAGDLTKGLHVMAGYSYNFMRYTKTLETGSVEGDRLVGTTAHTANGTVFYTFQDGAVKGLKLGASAFYTGKRNAGWNNTKVNVSENVDRLIAVDPFTTIDVSAGYSYKSWSILAKLSNITNAFSYYVHENYSVNPIAPRGFMTTLSYKF